MKIPVFIFLNLFFCLTLHAESLKTLVIIGDSLTEGYGIAKNDAYPQLLENSLKNWKVVNAGISGSTSASAASRTKWVIKSKPYAIIFALGGNDGLRGLSTEEMKKNLSSAIDIALQKNIKVILAGIEAPPNYGLAYTKKFKNVFIELSREKKIKFYPFLLKDVAGKPELNLADGIHPNEKGHQAIAKNLLPFLNKELP